MGQTITWIGWELNLSSACFSLPEVKRNKLYELVSECLRHRQVSRKQLDKLLGFLQWILHGMPTLRPWLWSLYDDIPWHQRQHQSHFVGWYWLSP